jgi:hypothetical protein
MDVVRSTANGLRNGIRRANQPTEIFMQPLPPNILNEMVAVFGGEYDMEMKAQMRGWHTHESLWKKSKNGNSELLPDIFRRHH